MYMRYRPSIWIISLLFVSFSLRTTAQDLSKSTQQVFISPQLSLHTLSGGEIRLSHALGKHEFELFIFLSPECPLCQNYSVPLNDLYLKFHNYSIAWIGIIPGRGFSDEQIQDFINRYHIRFPVYVDADMQLTHVLGASVTPQVILLNRKGKLLYTGAIDNWAVSLGQQRTIITQHYLQDALNNSLKGIPLTITRTQPVGCYINDF